MIQRTLSEIAELSERLGLSYSHLITLAVFFMKENNTSNLATQAFYDFVKEHRERRAVQ